MCKSLASVRETSVWLKPREWRESRTRLEGASSLREVCDFAQQEFGIIQNPAEIVPFLEYVREVGPQIVGEIGTKNGGNALLFVRALPPLRLHIGLDLLIRNAGKLRHFAQPGQRIVCIEGDSKAERAIKRVRAALRGRRFDLLFIDGDHTYEGVRADFENYSPLVKPGGLVAFHDIVPDHSLNDGPAADSNCWAGGVHQFWAEVRGRYEHREFVDDYGQNGFGIGVLVIDERPHAAGSEARRGRT